MANLMPAWTLVRVYGSWAHRVPTAETEDDKWVRSPGEWTVTYPGQLTNVTDDNMWTGGTYDSGELSVAEGEESIDVMIPATDDPDIEQAGEIKATIRLVVNGVPVTYVIDVPLANRPVESGGNGAGVNLRTIALASSIGPAVALYGVGTPGGLAKLSTDGTAVLDSDGDPIVGGGGASTLGGLSDVTTTGVTSGQVLKYNGTEWAPGTDNAGGGGASDWGDLGGTLSDQVDLQEALDAKAASSHSHPATGISDSTAVGRAVVTAANAAAARSAIGATDLEIGTTDTTAMAGNTTLAALGGTPTVVLTQAAYDAIAPGVPGVLYVVSG